MSAKRFRFLLPLLTALLLASSSAFASGTLTPAGSVDQTVQIRDHHVRVVINNGFAKTEVTQTFFNANDRDLEALYAFPIPESASLSEVTIWSGEKELRGEVLPTLEAETVYEEERDQGHDAGIASKNSFQTFEFRVSPVRAQSETRIQFVYYQPLHIDTGIGRYLYPMEDGGTDDPAALSFWTTNQHVEGKLSFELELHSAWPVADVRVPGHETEAVVESLGLDEFRVTLEQDNAHLDRDFIFYYHLQDDLPGRVEVIPYRADPSQPGTFMMVLTPGVDLAPLTGGSDYVFVLDVSGSMQGKIHTLSEGVARALGELDPRDRFRIVSFSSRALRVTGSFEAATVENVERAISRIEKLDTGGSTNLYAGLSLGLDDLDDDRATSLILVTDGVTNEGIVKPIEFHRLMEKVDIRVFGFLLGNNANWPLMRTICDASGGYYASVSNQDDILGQILLAKSKVTHEALHDVQVDISGIETFATSDQAIGKVYRGEQVVIFGRYAKGGRAELKLATRLTGEDKVYSASFEFPEIDTDHPELERLWALHRIEAFEAQERAGILPASEAEGAIEGLGVDYQLVTDYTSMIVLTEEAFTSRGIERRNRDRVDLERSAQTQRASQPVRNYRVDETKPMWKGKSHSTTNGSGAIDPITATVGLMIAGLGLLTSRRKKR